MLKLIVAMAENGVIGRDGGSIPWDYPEDLQHFKEETMGSVVIMGRVTYDSIIDKLDKPLPGRTTVVISSSAENVQLLDDESVRYASSIEEAIEIGQRISDGDDVYIAGGGSVYEQTIEMADELIVSLIPEWPSGEVRFPKISPNFTVEDSEIVGDIIVIYYINREI